MWLYLIMILKVIHIKSYIFKFKVQLSFLIRVTVWVSHRVNAIFQCACSYWVPISIWRKSRLTLLSVQGWWATNQFKHRLWNYGCESGFGDDVCILEEFSNFHLLKINFSRLFLWNNVLPHRCNLSRYWFQINFGNRRRWQLYWHDTPCLVRPPCLISQEFFSGLIPILIKYVGGLIE